MPKRQVEEMQGAVTGFHGTTKQKAEEIISRAAKGTPPFIESVNAGDWLGEGIYFWENAPQRAFVWARYRNPGHEIAVLQATIDLGACLDLFDLEIYRQIRSVYDKFIEFETSTGTTYVQEPLRVLDGKVYAGDIDYDHIRNRPPIHNFRDKQLIDWYAGFLEAGSPPFNVKSIRGIFLDGTAIYRESWLFDWSHVQICIRDQAVLSDISYYRA